MAQKTNIEWTDYNWNFIRGCSRVSEGCRHCYAETIAHRFSGEGQPYEGLTVIGSDGPRWNGKITFHEDILLQPLRWKKPHKVFVNSMSDLFHENVSDEILDKAFAVMALTPQHTYQILTKRPERMRDYIKTPHRYAGIALVMGEIAHGMGKEIMERGLDISLQMKEGYIFSNIWLGVSVEDQKTADERISILLEMPSACPWISAEPLLSQIDLQYWLSNFFRDASSTPWINRTLKWVVVGGESGPGARPFNIEWARKIIHDCEGAQCPVFIKQLGSNPYIHAEVKNQKTKSKGFEMSFASMTFDNTFTLSDKKGGNIAEFPKDLRVREYPEVRA